MIEELFKEGLLKKEAPSKEKALKSIEKAFEYVEFAKKNLEMGLFETAIMLAGNAADGVIFPTVKPGAGPAFAEFSSKYREKYNKEPPFLADFAYDTVNIIAAAMRQGNFDGKQIKDFLYRLENFPGAANTIAFDRNGDLENPALTLKTIKNGKIVEYEGE